VQLRDDKGYGGKGQLTNINGQAFA
jgi:hypothetical protein